MFDGANVPDIRVLSGELLLLLLLVGKPTTASLNVSEIMAGSWVHFLSFFSLTFTTAILLLFI